MASYLLTSLVRQLKITREKFMSLGVRKEVIEEGSNLMTKQRAFSFFQI